MFSCLKPLVEGLPRFYLTLRQIVRKAVNLFSVMDPETRYERRKDAPPVNPKKEEAEEAVSK